MISSMIDVFSARRRKDKALTDYNIIVTAIKNAAGKGESGCFVDGVHFNHSVNVRLQKDGFDTSSNLKGDGKTWVFWG